MVNLPEIEAIPIERIDVGDSTFSISHPETKSNLLEKIKEYGLLNPVILQRKRTRYRIVHGFRRVKAVRKLRGEEVLARVFPRKTRPWMLMALRLAEETEKQSFSSVEIAEILAKLNKFQTPSTFLQEKIFPLLKLNFSPKLMRNYLSLHSFHPALKRFLQLHPISLRKCLLFNEISPELQGVLAELAEKNSMGINFLLEIIKGVLQSSRKEKEDPEIILSTLGISTILRDENMNREQKVASIRAIFYQKQYPWLVNRNQEVQRIVQQLNLPPQIEILWDAEFEKPGFLTILKFSRKRDLEEILRYLNNEDYQSRLLNLLEYL